MPCIHSTPHRHFRPHFPPGSLQCRFSPELVSPLTHAMKLVFAKLNNGPADGTLESPPPSPLTPIVPTSLIPKPSGVVGRVGRGGYTLRDVLKQEHGKEYVAWLTNIWKRPCPILLKQNNLIDLLLSAKRSQKARKEQQLKDNELETAAKGKLEVCAPLDLQ
ncbi:hypothetical protein EDB86DRAFT_2837042 [Lactarius hatsudake]|nr:hypothetical protein EDB86DRAFT_2837042 [Lactarius hatsudake]